MKKYIIGATMLVFGVWFLVYSINTADKIYSGDLLLSQEEYTEFKQYLSGDDIAIKELNEYSFEPYLVVYKVQVPNDLDFTYNSDNGLVLADQFIPAAIILAIMVVGDPVVYSYFSRKLGW